MKKTISTLFAAAIVIASALPAEAYVLLSPRRRWASAPVVVRVNTTGNSTITDGDRGVSRTANAIGVWAFANGGTTSNSVVRGDGRAYIALHTNGNVCSGSCLAATLTGYYHQNSNGTYTIDDADVYTNTSTQFASMGESCSSEYYIEGVMVHEVGHVIGIGHSNVIGATMYPSVGACNNGPASLASDDSAAENDLY